MHDQIRELSIIIPAYNEGKKMRVTLEKILGYFWSRNASFEIIVVDDGSEDKGGEIVGDFSKKYPEVKILRHRTNLGKGAAVKTGVLEARGDYILFSDADLSTPIEEIEKLLMEVKEKEYDIAIGSRGLPDSKTVVFQPWYRRWVGRFFPRLVHLLVFKDIKDTQCGFKLFKKDVARKLFSSQRITGFSFDVETLYLAKKRGYRIKEIPVIWSDSTGSKVRILRDSFFMLKDLLRIRFTHKKRFP